jgi:hypothetical protein
MQVYSYHGRVERPAISSRLRRMHDGRAVSRTRTAVAMTAMAAAEKAKLNSDESSRLAGSKVKIIGKSHIAACALIPYNLL